MRTFYCSGCHPTIWLWLKFIVLKNARCFFVLPFDSSAIVVVVQLILIWETRFTWSYRAFFLCLLEPLILRNSQVFVTNVPTNVCDGFVSNIVIFRSFSLHLRLAFLFPSVIPDMAKVSDWTMWVVSIHSFDITTTICAIWPLFVCGSVGFYLLSHSMRGHQERKTF